MGTEIQRIIFVHAGRTTFVIYHFVFLIHRYHYANEWSANVVSKKI